MPASTPAPEPTAPDPAGHAGHDRVLVATYAAGDATGTGLETAIALVAACTACAALHHDLRLIAAALPGMPAPRRSRDFRLTEQQAASLRPSGWRRLLAPFAGPRFAFAAPLGSGLAALGIVGILLASTGLPLGGATAGMAPAEPPVAAVVPTAEDGSVNMSAATAGTAATVAPAPVAMAPAPVGSGAASAPAGGMSAVVTDKNAALAPGASPESAPGAAAPASTGSPVAAAPVAAPVASAGPTGSMGEAARALGARDQASGEPAGPLPILAAVMVIAGVALAGARVLARRIA